MHAPRPRYLPRDLPNKAAARVERRVTVITKLRPRTQRFSWHVGMNVGYYPVGSQALHLTCKSRTIGGLPLRHE